MRQVVCQTFAVLLGALIVSCASYRPDSLARLDAGFAPYAEEIDQVTVAAKKLTTAESKKYLDRDVIVKGYQPVQLSIDNRSAVTILFSPDRVSVPCAKPEDVARRVHTSTVGRVFAWGVPGLILWPFLIPAIIDGIGSSNANKDLDTDFAAKSLGQMAIEPKSFHEGLLFIPTEAFVSSFRVTLLERESKRELEFTVKAE